MTDWKSQVANFNAKQEDTESIKEQSIAVQSDGFFTRIGELLNNGTSVNMTIKKDDDKLTVSLLPKSSSKDEALSKISPIVMVGSASEFDIAFFANITASVNKFAEFSADAISFEKSMEKANEKSAMAKAKKEESKKKKEKIDKLLAETIPLLEKEDADGVRTILNKIAGLDPKSKHIAGLEESLTKINGPSLF